ncbi:uncharacterized protein LOC142982255 [Anticarsia gemmatalis]|uniref:uncharacterized protein LOC142982255 n=1 Tax=Anticarsia gemmatalis TaxID=129554 RepID=UPI003F7723E7
MFLLTLVIILQALTLSNSLIEKEGNFDLGNDIIKSEKDSMIAESKNNQHGERYRQLSIKKAQKILKDYVIHIKEKGTEILKSRGKELNKKIKVNINLTDVAHNYREKIDDYFEYTSAMKAETIVEKETALLDMVETACRLLYHEQKKLLINAITLNKSEMIETEESNDLDPISYFPIYNDNLQIQELMIDIYRKSKNIKSEEMQLNCVKFEICRFYPSYTDNIADFILEIINLPESKLKIVLKLLKILVKNEKFFKEIIDEEDIDIIRAKVKHILSDIDAVVQYLSVARYFIVEKFKRPNAEKPRLEIGVQAGKMLLDIIDKAFSYEDEDIIKMEFDTNFRAIRSWAKGEKLFPESVITQLFSYAIKVFETNLNTNAKNEIKGLLKILLTGRVADEKLRNMLYRDGSEYVRELIPF